MKKLLIGFFLLTMFESFSPDDTVKINSLNKLSVEFFNSDIAKSLQYANEALELAKKNNFPREIAVAQYNVGNALCTKENPKQGIDYLKLSLQYAEENKDKKIMRDCYGSLALAFAKMKNYERAFEYHQKYAEIKDEIFKMESERIFEETIEKYAVKEKDSSLKNLQVEIFKQQNELKKERQLRNYSVMSFAAVLLVVGGILFFKFRQK